jgi:hypothetical protein
MDIVPKKKKIKEKDNREIGNQGCCLTKQINNRQLSPLFKIQ